MGLVPPPLPVRAHDLGAAMKRAYGVYLDETILFHGAPRSTREIFAFEEDWILSGDDRTFAEFYVDEHDPGAPNRRTIPLDPGVFLTR